MDQVYEHQLYQLIHEYVERDEAAGSSRYASHPIFEHLTSLQIVGIGSVEFQDARVISYHLTHARRLKKLELELENLKIDGAFTRRIIDAPLEQLKIFDSSEITDVTIDVICQQLAASLRSLTLCGCTRVSRTGINKAGGEDIDVHCT